MSSNAWSVILETVSRDTEAPSNLGEVRRDLPSGQAKRRQRQHDLIHFSQSARPLLDDLAMERSVQVEGTSICTCPIAVDTILGRTHCMNYRDYDRPVVLVAAEMIAHLPFRRGLVPAWSASQQPGRANQLDAFLSRQ